MDEIRKQKLVKYWTLTRYFKYCEQYCKNSIMKDVYWEVCWNANEISYNPEAMLKVCPYETMRKVITMIQEMLKGTGIFDYALNGTEHDEITKIVDAKFREKVVKIEKVM